MTQHHDARMGETIELICQLGELVHASCGARSITHTRLGLDAIQAVYELSDDERNVLTRLIAQHRAISDSYLTLDQVADRFKVKRKVIKGLARWGALHGYKRHGAWVFSPRAVERFIEQHTYACGVLLIDAAEWQSARNPEA